MSSWNKPARARDGEALTPRQLEVLALVASGLSTPDVARHLEITPGTVKTHLTTIYRITGVRNRVQATRYYLDNHGPPSQV